MTKTNYTSTTKICVRCGTSFTRLQTEGRPPVTCDTCRENKATAPRPRYKRTCTVCGSEFTSLVHWAKTCSSRCNKAAYKARNPERYTLQNAQAKIREMAGEEYQRKIALTKMKRLLWRALNIRRLEERAKEKEINALSPCATCGKPVGLSDKAHLKYCSKECRDSSDVTKAVKRKSGIAYWAAKKGALVESVDPFVVFDRDRWRCQICGIKTPKEKRGTYSSDSPELDHILPLSKGGDHSYLNTQCLCKKCNRAKSNKPLGQTLLFG